MRLFAKFMGLLYLIWFVAAVATTAQAENLLTFGWSPSTGDDLGGYRMHYGPATGEYTHTADFGMGDLKPDGSVYYTISQDLLTFFDEGADRLFYAALVAYDAEGTYETEFSNEIRVERVPLPLTIPGNYRLEGVQEVSQITEDTTRTKTYTFLKESVQ